MFGGVERKYFADFLVSEKYLVEIKPRKLWDSMLVSVKKDAAICFCEANGFVYKLVDLGRISNAQIMLLYESGELVFTDRYSKLFKEKYL